MKTLRHIWNYLSDPAYRRMVDLVAVQEGYTTTLLVIRENMEKSNHPMYVCGYKKLKMVKLHHELSESEIQE